MSEKRIYETEYRITVKNDEAIAKGDKQAAAYKRAREEKEKLAKDVLPAGQAKELERAKSGMGALIRGGLIGAGVGFGADAGASLLRDMYAGQKTFNQSLNDAARELSEGLPLIGGLFKSMRNFTDQLSRGGEMAQTAIALRMYERSGDLRRGRYEINDAKMGLQGDAAGASARADAAREASIMAYVNRNELSPGDPRILAAQNALEGSRMGLAGANASRDAAKRGVGDYDAELSKLRAEQGEMDAARKGIAGFKEKTGGRFDVSAQEAELGKRALEIEKLIEEATKRRAANQTQYAASQKAVAEATLKVETDALQLSKQRLQVAKEAVQQFKDKAVAFDQMDPEQQFALSMTFDKAKAGGYDNLSPEEKRQLLNSGLAGNDLMEQARAAGARNQLFQGINAGQGGKTLAQLQAEEAAKLADFNKLAPKGEDSRLFELRAEFEEAVAKASLDAVLPLSNAIIDRINAGFAIITETLKGQDINKRALGL